VQAHNRLISSDETVSSMANRTGAIAGVNGDFFEIGGSGRPIGMVKINGRLLQSPTDYAVLGITQSGSPTINTESFSGSVTDGNASYPLDAINVYNDASRGKLVLLTPDLGTPPAIVGDTAVLLQPVDVSAGTFRVRAVQPYVSLSTLAGQYALIGNGSTANWMRAHLHRGNRINVQENISPDGDLAQAIGGGPILIQNGSIYHDPDPPAPREVYVRNPLTAVSVNSGRSHLSLTIFDGRGTGPVRSVGVTHAQAANYLLAHGASAAMLFDSGGSSTLVARLYGRHYASVVNWPADGFERPVANGLFVYSV
jgi:exopolysaccharide biosynthesis protein